MEFNFIFPKVCHLKEREVGSRKENDVFSNAVRGLGFFNCSAFHCSSVGVVLE